ncbi:membrane-bound transcription factor site-1 protease [Schistosoma bovis]|uniref:Membrane-bound transcription factor site-1 protease n=1 Tax=Schistosoma bovis TaxID=6184 RepID=A0A430QG04_SCHBO|nr:membrane-bound transcription factor site-1 protease [Schistosoma bovis]
MNLSLILITFLACLLTLGFPMPSYEYVSSVVETEFIISYYEHSCAQSRHRFLKSILNSFPLNYSIMERWYPPSNAIEKKSDFDVIKTLNLSRMNVSNFIQYLSNISQIKSVSPQKQINRVLLNYDINDEEFSHNSNRFDSRRNLKLFGDSQRYSSPGTLPLDPLKQPWKLLQAEYAWSRGLCGNGVRVGIFDTGLASPDHKHFSLSNIIERTDWTVDITNRSYSDDYIEALDRHGHGTYVTGLIAAQNPNVYYSKFINSFNKHDDSTCPPWGFAPSADLFIFRVFTDTQISYTSWFLDAFNYAISRKLHVLELSANGILLVSAIGNDGPLFGTLNNPADQMDVLGVGGVDALGRVARFSSRGMTGWELPAGYGRVKPDIVTFSTGVISSNLDGKCRVLSGTSVASPIVTGVVSLLINAALNHNANLINHENGSLYYMNNVDNYPFVPVNPISIKQALIASANQLDSVRVFGTNSIKWLQETDQSSMFEQGAGLVNLQSALEIVQRMKPQASLMPSYLDLTQCPYMWPYCSQPLYSTMQPIIINNNTTIHSRYSAALNHNANLINHENGSLYYMNNVDNYPFVPVNPISIKQALIASANQLDSVRVFGTNSIKWLQETDQSSMFEQGAGLVNLQSALEIVQRMKPQATRWNSERCSIFDSHLIVDLLGLNVRHRHIKRILFDQFHSIHYPSGFIPRDDLTRSKEPLDWLGDHIHTNFLDLYTHLRRKSYFIEVLTSTFDCFNASNYGTFLIIDPEEEFFPYEVEKLFIDVTEKGLSLIVFADWYNTSVMQSLRFYDTNTRCGSFNRYKDKVMQSVNCTNLLRIYMNYVAYHSGSSLRKFPNQAIANHTGRTALLKVNLVDIGKQFIQHDSMFSKSESEPSLEGDKILVNSEPNLRLKPIIGKDPTPAILGLWTPIVENVVSEMGRLSIYGDSDCLSSTHLSSNSQLNLYSNVIKKEWDSSTLNTSYLPLEAYYSVKSCYIAPTASISIDKDEPNESFYHPQRLLLYPVELYPSEKLYTTHYCHSFTSILSSDKNSFLINKPKLLLQSINDFIQLDLYTSYSVNFICVIILLIVVCYFCKHCIMYFSNSILYVTGWILSMIRYMLVRILFGLYNLWRVHISDFSKKVFSKVYATNNSTGSSSTTTAEISLLSPSIVQKISQQNRSNIHVCVHR